MNFSNIKYKGNVQKEIIDKLDPYHNISLYKDIEYFYEQKTFDTFIKAVEAEVRGSKEYKHFINYVTDILGINYCQINPEIFKSDKVTVEMHHGPLFTLYDYCKIVTVTYIKQNKRITTFRITDQVIQEHYDLNVKVVMCTATNHEAIHNRDIFINVNQGIGDMNAFIEKYAFALDDDYKFRLYRYMKLCEENKSFDQGILDTDHIKPLIDIAS